MSTPYVGEIRLFPYNFAPYGWAMCNGALMAISENTVLFDLIGTTYGGDGLNTFAVPNLLGRVAVHFGSNGFRTYVQGELSGAENATLTAANLPPHNHTVAPPVATTSTSVDPSGLVPGLTAHAAYGTPSVDHHAAAFGSGATGSNLPFETRSPYLALCYCISLFGIFPSQS